MKPLLKWAGGKRHIATGLQDRFPESWNQGTYFEPFLGGAALLLHLDPNKSVVSDVNLRLISFYRHVKAMPSTLFEGIERIKTEFEELVPDAKKDYYIDLRTRFNASGAESLDSAIMFYVLNKLCFNGLYRENSRGEFNVPFGQKKSLQILSYSELESVSKLLSKTEILNSDFQVTVREARRGDFVYFDPPYVPISETASFTSYSSGGFGIAEQERLAELMLELQADGVAALCSNSDTPLARKIYARLNLGTIRAPRMVSASAAGRGSVSELVITNY